MGDTLKAIVKRTMPNPKYARYHERHLQRFLSRLGSDPPRYVLLHHESVCRCLRVLTSRLFVL